VIKTKKKTSAYPLEVEEQKACWNWLGLQLLGPNSGETLQDYSYMVPNGTQLAGSRNRRAAYMASLKAQGFRVGVSDLVIAVPIGEYHGAYIELKRVREAYAGPAALASAIRPDQKDWLIKMHTMGYWVAVAYGDYDFRRQVRSYMRKEDPDRLDFIPGMRDTRSAQ
jgi:hypothetical protein